MAIGTRVIIKPKELLKANAIKLTCTISANTLADTEYWLIISANKLVVKTVRIITDAEIRANMVAMYDKKYEYLLPEDQAESTDVTYNLSDWCEGGVECKEFSVVGKVSVDTTADRVLTAYVYYAYI